MDGGSKNQCDTCRKKRRSRWRRCILVARRMANPAIDCAIDAKTPLARHAHVCGQAKTLLSVQFEFPHSSFSAGILQKEHSASANEHQDGARSDAAERKKINMNRNRLGIIGAVLAVILILWLLGDSSITCRESFWDKDKTIIEVK